MTEIDWGEQIVDTILKAGGTKMVPSDDDLLREVDQIGRRLTTLRKEFKRRGMKLTVSSNWGKVKVKVTRTVLEVEG